MRIKRDISVFFSMAFVFLIVFAHISVAQNLEFASDLIVLDTEVSFSEDNEYLILTVEITNMGNITCESFFVSVTNPNDGWPDTQFNFSGVEAGKSTAKEFQLEIPEEKRGKWINLTVTIDPKNRISELREDNNEKQISEIFIPEKMSDLEINRPDLVINSADAWISEDKKSVIIDVNITNEGDRGSDDFLVTAKDPEGAWMGSEKRVDGGLDGGETRAIELILRIPEEYSEGTKAFEVEVDPERKSGDVNHENNRFTVQVPFLEKKPDLVILSTDSQVSEDESNITFEVEYSNKGDAPANEFLITIGNPEEGWADTQEEIVKLDSGVSATAKRSVDIPEEQRGKTLAFIAEIDPDNRIDELDEENNLAWTSEVFIPLKSKPELTILAANAWVSEDEDTVIISAEIANEGNTSADSFVLSAGNPDEEWADTQITVRGLKSGENITVEKELEIPNEQREKEFAFRVIIDPENKIEEIDEENNIIWTKETFIPPVQAIDSGTGAPEEVPSITEITEEVPSTPDGNQDGEDLWKIIVTITLTITIGGLVKVNHSIKVRRRTTWESKAVEETPEKCEPRTEFCLKIKPKPRQITHLSLNAYDSVSGNKIKEDIKGETVDDLNEALLNFYSNEKPEVQRKNIESISSKLLEEIKDWLSEEKANFDVSIFVYLEGSEVTGQYVRYCCEQPDKPAEKEKWKKTFKDTSDKELGTLSKLNPFEPIMSEKLKPELTKMLTEFIENTCKCPGMD
ncbi:MAG TPA: CARDB domain-containing protein [Methanosarcina sp.]|nr:CARDB domain-containing protein [Methanosarcina sp.]